MLHVKKAVEHRIVSIYRPYIRPIIRGKENKRVEFGAKVNNIQIDGISFIEHLSFEAFNEGIKIRISEECHYAFEFSFFCLNAIGDIPRYFFVNLHRKEELGKSKTEHISFTDKVVLSK